MVVDDHPDVRAGLVATLAHASDVAIVAEASTSADAIGAADATRLDVALVECGLPGASGADVCRTLRERHPTIRTIALTGRREEGRIVEVLAAGARGVLTKNVSPATLLHAVHAVASGGVFIDPRLAEHVVRLALMSQRAKGPYGLSQQELRVLERLPRGLTNREIAAELGLSEETVKSHVRKILRKTGTRDRAEAAALAVRGGLV